MPSPYRIAIVSLVGSTTITLVKGLVALITGSLAALTETADSILDIVYNVAALYAVKKASEPPDMDHPYGHTKYENLLAYTESIFAILAASGLIFEAIRRLVTFFEIFNADIGSIVIASSTVVSFMIALLNYWGYRVTGNIALRANVLNFSGDVIRGVTVAITLFLVHIGFKTLDPIVSIGLATFLVIEALKLMKEATFPLLDTISPRVLEAIEKDIRNVHGVREVRVIKARDAGGYIHVEATILVDPKLNIREAHRISSKVEELIREKYGRVLCCIHVEPLPEI